MKTRTLTQFMDVNGLAPCALTPLAQRPDLNDIVVVGCQGQLGHGLVGGDGLGIVVAVSAAHHLGR